ncbi:MAG: hypothetical protein KUG65_05960 [Sphingomonadaceae bacterium]|nr:hypothetical protein [Sphingomonadaceae bacterium]
MGKRNAKSDQLGFAFEPPAPATLPAALAGLERQISGLVSTILHDEERSRLVLAAEVSELLGENVSKEMLDAYSSAAREGHRVPMSRFLALVAVCSRQDLLDQAVRPVGAAVLVGEEVHTARLGHIQRQIERLQTERKKIRGLAPLIRGKHADG